MHGYLFSYILRVFDVRGVHAIPDKYIMQRWTGQARSELSNAEKIVMMMSNFNRLAHRTKGHSIYVDRIMKLISEEEQFIDNTEVENESNVPANSSTEPIDVSVAGLKEKESNKGRRRKWELSCLEKRKKGSSSTQKNNPYLRVTNNQPVHEAGINLCLKI